MKKNKNNTALDLRNLTKFELSKLSLLGKNTINRLGHTGLCSLSETNEWSIFIFHDEEYKRVFPEFSDLKKYTLIGFEEFIKIHF